MDCKDSLVSECGPLATQPFVQWVNARSTLYFPFSPPGPNSNSEVKDHLLTSFFFHQRGKNGLPRKLSKKLHLAFILQEENLSETDLCLLLQTHLAHFWYLWIPRWIKLPSLGMPNTTTLVELLFRRALTSHLI